MAGVAEAIHPLNFISSLYDAVSFAPAAVPFPPPADLAPSFDNLHVEIEPRQGVYWCYMRPGERPSFTPGLLSDLADMQRGLMGMFAGDATPIRYYVLASELPGIFNLGGDLTVLAERIRRQDRAGLARYARSCIDVLYTNAIGFNLPVVTVALVQGDALGGGFEAALSCDVIIAEKGSRFGLPEVLFNLFPGMGAYSFLARRLGAARAEKMILSGRIYPAEELYEMDVVQVLAEPGTGEQAVRDFIERNGKRHNAQSGVFRAGRRVSPLSYDELRDISEIWVDTALGLSESDLRKMERLTAAQNRRWTGQQQIAAAE
jgi:DSF synthase